MKKYLFYYTISQVLYTFLATLLIVVGYLVAPILFSALESKPAGDIAGLLFIISGYITLFLVLMMLMWQFWLKLGWRFYWQSIFVIPIMATLLLFITPWMNEIKALYPQGLTKESPDWPLFASLHGLYQLAYLVVIIMLIWAMLKSVNSMKSVGFKG